MRDGSRPLQCEFRGRVSPDLSRDLPEIRKWPATLRSSLFEAAREADEITSKSGDSSSA